MNAVTAFFALAILLVASGQSLDFFGVMTAVGILLMTVLIAIASVRLPGKYPVMYQKAYFRLSKPWLVIVVAVSVLSCLGFIFLVLMELPLVGGIYAVWILLVVVYHKLRVRSLKAGGVDYDALVARIPGFDEEP
jgi:hypothetical protein